MSKYLRACLVGRSTVTPKTTRGHYIVIGYTRMGFLTNLHKFKVGKYRPSKLSWDRKHKQSKQTSLHASTHGNNLETCTGNRTITESKNITQDPGKTIKFISTRKLTFLQHIKHVTCIL